MSGRTESGAPWKTNAIKERGPESYVIHVAFFVIRALCTRITGVPCDEGGGCAVRSQKSDL